MKSAMFRLVSLRLIAGAVVATGALGGSLAAQMAKVETVATLPASEFILESLVETSDGSIYISGLDDHTIYKVSPTREVSTFATLPVAAVVGITSSNDGFLATAFANPPAGAVLTGRPRPPLVGSLVLVLDKSGNVTATIEGEKGAAFNSITPAVGDAYLITDTTGSIWRLDLAARKISLWLRHPAFSPTPAVRYGSNGIKIRDGWVYVGVMSRKEIYRVRMTNDGRPAGEPEKFAEGFTPDDFDFGPDGSLYGTWTGDTKMYKVSPSGKVTVLLEDVPGAAATLVSKDGRWLYWPNRTRTTPGRLLRTSIHN